MDSIEFALAAVVATVLGMFAVQEVIERLAARRARRAGNVSQGDGR